MSEVVRNEAVVEALSTDFTSLVAKECLRPMEAIQDFRAVPRKYASTAFAKDQRTAMVRPVERLASQGGAWLRRRLVIHESTPGNPSVLVCDLNEAVTRGFRASKIAQITLRALPPPKLSALVFDIIGEEPLVLRSDALRMKRDEETLCHLQDVVSVLVFLSTVRPFHLRIEKGFDVATSGLGVHRLPVRNGSVRRLFTSAEELRQYSLFSAHDATPGADSGSKSIEAEIWVGGKWTSRLMQVQTGNEKKKSLALLDPKSRKPSAAALECTQFQRVVLRFEADVFRFQLEHATGEPLLCRLTEASVKESSSSLLDLLREIIFNRFSPLECYSDGLVDDCGSPLRVKSIAFDPSDPRSPRSPSGGQSAQQDQNIGRILWLDTSAEDDVPLRRASPPTLLSVGDATREESIKALVSHLKALSSDDEVLRVQGIARFHEKWTDCSVVGQGTQVVVGGSPKNEVDVIDLEKLQRIHLLSTTDGTVEFLLLVSTNASLVVLANGNMDKEPKQPSTTSLKLVASWLSRHSCSKQTSRPAPLTLQYVSNTERLRENPVRAYLENTELFTNRVSLMLSEDTAPYVESSYTSPVSSFRVVPRSSGTAAEPPAVSTTEAREPLSEASPTVVESSSSFSEVREAPSNGQAVVPHSAMYLQQQSDWKAVLLRGNQQLPMQSTNLKRLSQLPDFCVVPSKYASADFVKQRILLLIRPVEVDLTPGGAIRRRWVLSSSLGVEPPKSDATIASLLTLSLWDTSNGKLIQSHTLDHLSEVAVITKSSWATPNKQPNGGGRGWQTLATTVGQKPSVEVTVQLKFTGGGKDGAASQWVLKTDSQRVKKDPSSISDPRDMVSPIVVACSMSNHPLRVSFFHANGDQPQLLEVLGETSKIEEKAKVEVGTMALLLQAASWGKKAIEEAAPPPTPEDKEPEKQEEPLNAEKEEPSEPNPAAESSSSLSEAEKIRLQEEAEEAARDLEAKYYWAFRAIEQGETDGRRQLEVEEEEQRPEFNILDSDDDVGDTNMDAKEPPLAAAPPADNPIPVKAAAESKPLPLESVPVAPPPIEWSITDASEEGRLLWKDILVKEILGREDVIEAERSATEALLKASVEGLAQLKGKLKSADEGRSHPPTVAIVIKVDEI